MDRRVHSFPLLRQWRLIDSDTHYVIKGRYVHRYLVTTYIGNIPPVFTDDK